MSIFHLWCVRAQCRAWSSLVLSRVFLSIGLAAAGQVHCVHYDMRWQRDRLVAVDHPLPHADVAPARPAAGPRDEVYIMPAAAAPAQASSCKEAFLCMGQARFQTPGLRKLQHMHLYLVTCNHDAQLSE